MTLSYIVYRRTYNLLLLAHQTVSWFVFTELLISIQILSKTIGKFKKWFIFRNKHDS